jgi:hypothetical protein
MNAQIGLQNLSRGSWTFMLNFILKPSLKLSFLTLWELWFFTTSFLSLDGLEMYDYGLETCYCSISSNHLVEEK